MCFMIVTETTPKLHEFRDQMVPKQNQNSVFSISLAQLAGELLHLHGVHGMDALLNHLFTVPYDYEVIESIGLPVLPPAKSL